MILAITGAVLSSSYREAVERSFDRRLDVFLRTLVADVASPPEDTLDKLAPALGEPLFDLPLSGWYWQVTKLTAQKPDVHSSRSLWDGNLPHLDELGVATDAEGTRRSYVSGPDEQKLRLIERTVDLGEDGRFRIGVAGDPQEIDEEMRSFDQALVVTFGVLTTVLLLTTMFQVRFGLAPLKRLSESLTAIRSGSAERLEGDFPVEIEPLARETNALIDANKQIVERARTHVGNLAHALKTPLSVVVNEAAARGNDAFAAKVREQVDIMRDQVARHLERAHLAARLTVVGTITEVSPVVAALARTLEKLHRDRGIAIDLHTSAEARFQGERQDLEEMVGNLVDNACKWARSRVSIEVMVVPAEARQKSMIHIFVDDDGVGLTPQQRQQVAHRGQRLDETKPGSGLGLSIVVELAALYGGYLTLETAPIGGLRAELVLPSI